MATIIRPATIDDLGAISEIYADAVLHGTASYELEPPGKPEMQRRFEALVGAGMPYLVASDGETVVGYAYAGFFRTRPAYRFIVEDSVYVHPRFRGRGIGRMLLERLVAEIEMRGFRQVVAVIGDGRNNQASVQLHEATGFRHSGCLVGSGFKHGRWLDTVFMQMALNGGTETLPVDET